MKRQGKKDKGVDERQRRGGVSAVKRGEARQGGDTRLCDLTK